MFTRYPLSVFERNMCSFMGLFKDNDRVVYEVYSDTAVYI